MKNGNDEQSSNSGWDSLCILYNNAIGTDMNATLPPAKGKEQSSRNPLAL